jgi:hypothetical protein
MVFSVVWACHPREPNANLAPSLPGLGFRVRIVKRYFRYLKTYFELRARVT